jgi:hypothetical protein
MIDNRALQKENVGVSERPLMQRSCMPASLCESLRRGLDAYAIAASAAGVGMLALAPAAEGRIIFTPAYHRIPVNTNFNLDLNHDGIVDFVVHNFYHLYSSGGGVVVRSSLNAVAPGCRVHNYAVYCPNALQTYSVNFIFGAAALPKGAKIGPTSSLFRGAEMIFLGHTYSEAGFWAGATNRYLGVRFLDVKGATHYGWARFTVRDARTSKMVAVLTGYAYETVPEKPIIAGKMFGEDDPSDNPDDSEHVPGPGASAVNPLPGVPQSAPLGALALGYQGIALWRRSESANEMPQSN